MVTNRQAALYAADLEQKSLDRRDSPIKAIRGDLIQTSIQNPEGIGHSVNLDKINWAWPPVDNFWALGGRFRHNGL
jgi:hypothetical protein